MTPPVQPPTEVEPEAVEAPGPAPDSAPMTVSLVVQMSPVWRPGWASEAAFDGDLSGYAEHLTRYFATQLERFAEQRGADLFVMVTARRADQTAGHEYRSGHYVQPAKEETDASASHAR